MMGEQPGLDLDSGEGLAPSGSGQVVDQVPGDQTPGAEIPADQTVLPGDQAPDHLDIPQEKPSKGILVQCAARVGAAVWLSDGSVLRSGDRARLSKKEAEGLLKSGVVLPV